MLELKPANEMSDEQLLALLTEQNEQYRSTGESQIADVVYDQYKAEFMARQPDHSFNIEVEAEPDFGAKKIRHKGRPLLSTEKAYTTGEIQAWINRQIKGANEVGVDPNTLIVRVTPKYDGMCARKYPDSALVSRGDGTTGSDISHLLEKGLVIKGSGSGVLNGELMVDQAYFDQYLKDVFAHPRGVVVGMASADNIRPEALEALQDGAIHMVCYDHAPRIEMPLKELTERLDEVWDSLLSNLGYAYDGLVAEITDETVKEAMGYGSHHYNWQIAIKRQTEIKDTVVKEIIWQVGRTSVISPVLSVEPVMLSGARVSRITGHNAANILNAGIGVGAVISATRAGEVIPFLTNVVKAVDASQDLPTHCPSCSSPLQWCQNNIRLLCTGSACPAQQAQVIEFHFKTLGIDGFGPAACETLTASELFDSIASIHFASLDDFKKAGLSAGIARNIHAEINRSRRTALDDFKILASLGIQHLGRGDSKKLLKEFSLETLAQTSIDASEIEAINGFGQLTAEAISKGLDANRDLLQVLWKFYGDVVVKTPTRADAASIESPIAGRHIVFTGSMQNMTREQMQKQAEALGAINQSSVNKKTDLLVTGEKVGASKMNKARELGVKVMTEAEYLELIGGN